jgi:hypothetical protein
MFTTNSEALCGDASVPNSPTKPDSSSDDEGGAQDKIVSLESHN